MKKIKVAIVGVGTISQHHIVSYLQNPNVELYAFCDINEETLRAKGEKYGVTRLYTSEAEMLKALPEIDAVSVCTWNAAHAECTIAALEAGKHVLCEKPMAIHADAAQKMIDAAKRNKRKLMVGFVRRFGHDCNVVKDFIGGGALGDIYYAKASYLRRCGCPGGWFGSKELAGGGPFIDLGVHVIDLVRYLMGGPKPVAVSAAAFNKLGARKHLKDKSPYAAQGAVENAYDVEDLMAAFIRFDNGALLTIDASFNLNVKQNVNTIELFGTKGGVKIDPKFNLYTEMNNYLTDVNVYMPTEFKFEEAFAQEIDCFIDAILGDKDLSGIAEDGLTLMKILDAAYRSAKENREIQID